jgi:hypothetical protein
MLAEAKITSGLYTGTHDYRVQKTLGEKFRIYGEWKANDLDMVLSHPYHTTVDSEASSMTSLGSRLWDDVITPASGRIPINRKVYQPSLNIFEVLP